MKKSIKLEIPQTKIVEAWARFFGVDIQDVGNSSRVRPLMLYKHVLRHLLYKYTKLSLKDIAVATGAVDHSTARHSSRLVSDWIEVGDDFAVISVRAIEKNIKN